MMYSSTTALIPCCAVFAAAPLGDSGRSCGRRLQLPTYTYRGRIEHLPRRFPLLVLVVGSGAMYYCSSSQGMGALRGPILQTRGLRRFVNCGGCSNDFASLRESLKAGSYPLFLQHVRDVFKPGRLVRLRRLLA